MGPGPQDLGPQDPVAPPQSLKVGPRTPLELKRVTPGPSSKFKSRTASPFFHEVIFFRMLHLFFTYLIFCLFLNKIQKRYQL